VVGSLHAPESQTQQSREGRVGGVWRCCRDAERWTLDSGGVLGMRVDESCPTATFCARALVDDLPRVDSTNQSINIDIFLIYSSLFTLS
jgi:hypothetical protein